MTAHPGLIPYVDYHQGARRVLTFELTSGNSMMTAKHRPIVSVDGRQYVVVWGSVSFEVPADRNVHVSVHLEGQAIGQVASMLLSPGEDAVAYRYATQMSGGATLTPLSTLR